MSWWGWVSIGVVVGALLILVVVGLGTAGRLRPLAAAAAEARNQPGLAPLQARVQELSGEVAYVQQRVQMTQERISDLKAARADAGDA